MKQFPDEIIEFLKRPRQIAVLSTVGAQGFPHMTPMWYAYQDGSFWLWTRKERIKYANTRRNPRVGLYIQAQDDVHLGMTLKGTVEHHGAVSNSWAETIAGRYVDQEELAIWVDHILYGQSALLQIRPTWWARNGSSWNL